MKKTYTKPQLVIHGDIDKLTQSAGGTSTDVPLGTPVGPNGIGDVAGDPS